jgi:hypothetical protein
MEEPVIALKNEMFLVYHYPMVSEVDGQTEEHLRKCAVIYNSPTGKYQKEFGVAIELLDEPEWYKYVCDSTVESYESYIKRDNTL